MLITYVYDCVHVCACARVRATALVWRSEDTLGGRPFFSILGTLEIELRSSGMAAGAFTAGPPYKHSDAIFWTLADVCLM